MRGYKMEEREGESEIAYEVRRAAVKSLAERWDYLERTIEAARVRAELAQEEGYVYEDEQADEEAEELGQEAYDAAKLAAQQAGKSQEEADSLAAAAQEEATDNFWSRYRSPLDQKFDRLYAEQEIVEQQLHALDARMMRPYEHWGEAEKQVQRMENGGGWCF